MLTLERPARSFGLSCTYTGVSAASKALRLSRFRARRFSPARACSVPPTGRGSGSNGPESSIQMIEAISAPGLRHSQAATIVDWT
jgi:hypothetical protein